MHSVHEHSLTLVLQVALVGAPNVGKSSLVQVLSSGEPEVCDYPFTTRSIKMGHFYVDSAAPPGGITTLQFKDYSRCSETCL